MTRTQVCECVKLCAEMNCKECQLDGIEDCVNLLLGEVVNVLREDTKTINSLYEKLGESRAATK